MKWLLLLTGLICSGHGAEISDFEDVFSVLTNNKHFLKNTNHKSEKNRNGRSAVVQETYEMGFPPFPPLFYDNLPMPNAVKTSVDEKDIFSDTEQKESVNNLKQKKKPKDKVIMSFTEFFIPFMNHKNSYDFPSFPKKFDFFDNIFKNFGFKDIDEPILKITKQQKIVPNKNVTKFQGTIAENSSTSDLKKSERLKSFDSLFLHNKPKETEVEILQSGLENEKEPICCRIHECRRSCHKGICMEPTQGADRKRKLAEELDEDDDEYFIRTGLKQEIPRNKKEQSEESILDKVLKVSLLYTVPILIGIGGAIIALEILRRDSRGKRSHQLAKEYGPVQHC